ncbi:MAG: tetratricopeptide repeat protein [Acidobacteriota bacterium]
MVKVSWVPVLLAALLLAAPAAGADKAQQYMEQGSALVSQKRHLEAIQAFTLAIEADPKQAEGYRKRAISRKAIGDYKEAIKDYDQAIELDPTSSRAYNGRGETKLSLKDRDGAIADINKAVELDPENANAWFVLGRFNEEAGNLPGALASYNRAIKVDPKNSLAWFGRGNVRAAMDDDKGSIADFTEVIKLDPKLSGAASNRGAAKERLGDLEGAAGDYRKELEIDPDDRDAKGNLARVQGILDQRAEAAKAPAGGARSSGGLTRPPPIDTRAWLPKNLTTEVPDEPCKPAQAIGRDVPWQPDLTSAPKAPAVVAGGIAPFGGINAIAEARFDGGVSATIEGMRLLIGPMSSAEEAVFDKKWLPLRDFPTPEVVDYCAKLNPLLGQLLSLRGAIAQAAQDFDDAWGEAATAAEMDADSPTREALGVAQQNKILLEGLSGQAKDVAAQIEKLGNPPDPWARKCAARKAHEKAVEETKNLPGQGDSDYSAMEGEWEGLAEPPNEFVTRNFPVEAVYLVTWVVEIEIEPMSSRRPALAFYWLSMGGDYRRTFFAFLTNDRTVGMGPRKEVELRGDTLVVHFGNDRWTLKRVDSPECAVPGFTPADLDVWKARCRRAREDPDSVDSRACEGGPVLEANTRLRRLAHSLLPGKLLNPPEEATDWLSGKYQDWARNEYEKLLAAAPPDLAGPRGSGKAGEQDAGAGEKSAEAEARGLKQERIAFHRSAIAINEASMRRDQAALAKETNPESRAALQFRLIQYASNIQEERDRIATIESGSVVYTRSAFDDYARAGFVDKIEKESKRVADEYQRANTAAGRLVPSAPPEIRQEIRELVERRLGPNAARSLDAGAARKVVAEIHEKITRYNRVQRAEALRDEARADLELFQYEKVKEYANGALALCVLGGGPVLGMVAYQGATGTIEGGPKEGASRAAEWFSTPTYIAAQAMRGYESGGVQGAVTGAGAAFFIGKLWGYGAGAAMRVGAKLFKGSPKLTFLEAQKLSQHRKAQYDGRVAVEDLKNMQRQLQEAAARGGKPAEIAKLQKSLRDQAALINESPEAKMFLKNLASAPERAGLTRVAAEQLNKAYSLHLTEVHQRAAFEFNVIMAAKGFNPQKLREFRNSASAGSAGMDHDIGLVEQDWFVRDLFGRKKFDPWLTREVRVGGHLVEVRPATVREWQREASIAWAEAYKKTTGRNPHKSFEEATSSKLGEAYRDAAWLGQEGSKFADIDKVRKGWAQQAADVTSFKAQQMLTDPKLGLTQMQRVAEAGRGMAKDMRTKLMPALDKAIKAAPGDAKRLGKIKEHWSEVADALAHATDNPIEAMRKVRMLTGGKDLVQVIHDLNSVMGAFGKAAGR